MNEGVTKAVKVSARIRRRPGMSVRATSQADGTPRPTEMTATEAANINEFRIGRSSAGEETILQ